MYATPLSTIFQLLHVVHVWFVEETTDLSRSLTLYHIWLYRGHHTTDGKWTRSFSCCRHWSHDQKKDNTHEENLFFNYLSGPTVIKLSSTIFVLVLQNHPMRTKYLYNTMFSLAGGLFGYKYKLILKSCMTESQRLSHRVLKPKEIYMVIVHGC